MSEINSPQLVYWTDYEYNPGVISVFMSSYPNNPGVITTCISNYPNNPGVRPIYRSNYEYNPGVQKIYMIGCFPKSELVNTSSDEYVPIGTLKIGDKISSWDVKKEKILFTAVTGIHNYTVNDIMCFNNSMRVSSSHPLMVLEKDGNGLIMPKWKVAFDVKVGDSIVGVGGKLVAVKSKTRHWYDAGIEVLSLSTDSGSPFFVANCVVRAENAQDCIEWADTPVTQKLVA